MYSCAGDAYADALTALLPVFDNLDRAASFAGDSGMADGIKMILTQFENALSSMGVEAFGAVGEEFDPNLHNAVMQEENEEFADEEISENYDTDNEENYISSEEAEEKENGSNN